MTKIEGDCTMYIPEEPNYNKEEVDKMEKKNARLRDIISCNSEEEYCD